MENEDITQPVLELTNENIQTNTTQIEITHSPIATSPPIRKTSVRNLEITSSQNECVPALDTAVTQQELSVSNLETITAQVELPSNPEPTQSIQELLATNIQAITTQPESSLNSNLIQQLHDVPTRSLGIFSPNETTSNFNTGTQDLSNRNSGTVSLSESAPSSAENNITPTILGPIPPIVNTKHLVGPKSTILTCHICGNKIQTVVYHSTRVKTHIIAICLCLSGCSCCACIPYCLKSGLNVDHYCSYCSSFLGTYLSK